MLLLQIIRAAELEEMQEIERIGDKLLVTSAEQLCFKKLSIRSELLVQTFSEMRDLAKQMNDELQIIDRARAKRLCVIVCSAILLQFEKDSEVRRQGEHEAAYRICAFFRLIQAKVTLIPNAKRAKQERSLTNLLDEVALIDQEPVSDLRESVVESPDVAVSITNDLRQLPPVDRVAVEEASSKVVISFSFNCLSQNFFGEK